MPLAAPPSQGDLTPNITGLPAYTRLWRLHRQSRPSREFNNQISDAVFGGGRFDPTDGDPYPFLYAGLSPQVPLTEFLLRPIAPDRQGHRYLTRASITDQRLSALDTMVPLKLISLVDGRDLAAVGQDSWLVATGSSDFAATRVWARWLRAAASDAHGLIWQPAGSARNGDLAVVLFGDRLDESALQESSITIRLDTAEGTERLNEYLAPWRAAVRLPELPRLTEQAPDTAGPPLETSSAALADFHAFYKSSFRMIRRITYATTLDMDLATEATDDAFLIALRKWEEVVGMENPVGYVVTIACRIARRALGKRIARDLSLDAHPEIQPESSSTISPDSVVSRDALERALRAIPTAQAECFLLHHLCGYTVREIAAHQEVAEGTVKSRLHSARTVLRELLGKDFREGGLQ